MLPSLLILMEHSIQSSNDEIKYEILILNINIKLNIIASRFECLQINKIDNLK